MKVNDQEVHKHTPSWHKTANWKGLLAEKGPHQFSLVRPFTILVGNHPAIIADIVIPTTTINKDKSVMISKWESC